jgi:hypothetical protein
MAVADGRRFELFSIPAVREDQAAMYRHLPGAVQPEWWLKRVRT